MEKKTKSDHPSSKFDRISDLPWHLLDNIMVRLPLKTAVRTSILSKNWRYKWTTLSSLEICHLDFLKQFPKSEEEEVALKKKMTIAIYEILFHHHDKIDKFTIYSKVKLDSYDLDQWLLFLSTKNIMEFTFLVAVDSGTNYKLHSSLFSCQQLDNLELLHCILELPSAFKGFIKLRSLVLVSITTKDEDLGSLVQSCPLLEEVEFKEIQGLSNVKINAPNLKSLKFDCFFDDISIENTPVLEYFSLYCAHKAGAKQRKKPRMVSNLVRVLGGLSSLKHLEICGRFAKYLTVGGVPEKVPTSYNQLKNLTFRYFSFNKLEQIRVAFSILRSSPSLKELHFKNVKYIPPSDMELQPILNFMEAQRHSSISFSKLQFAFLDFFGMRSEIEFVKLVLASSPILEKILLDKYRDISNETIMRDLLELERASARAKLTYTSYEG